MNCLDFLNHIRADFDLDSQEVSMFDVVIIGGGASGLMTAALCSMKGKKCLVVEHMPVCGKKILMTGNGKCNITNLEMYRDNYNCSEDGFMEQILSEVSPNRVIEVFENLGMLTRDRDGYVYPYSEQAAAVKNLLVTRCMENGVEFLYECEVAAIENIDERFVITSDNMSYEGKSVILATGGMSYKKTGSDGSGYALAKKFGHTVNHCVPALTALICKEKFFKEISGVRAKGNVMLYLDDKIMSSELGEVQFTDYGLSGIPIFNLSRDVAYMLKKKKKPHVIIDLFPNISQEKLTTWFRESKRKYPKTKLTDSLSYIINVKLATTIAKNAGVSYSAKMGEIDDSRIGKIVSMLKTFEIEVVNVKGFDYCQVTAGGIDVNEIDAHSFESKLCKNLYIIGEMLDVDGMCGGYNLHFAFAGAILASDSIG